MTGTWRIEYDRENCIGAGACVAADPHFWDIDEEGKATLKGATYDADRKLWILEVKSDENLERHRAAAEVCPVNVIHLINPEGEKEI